ncbi:MAG: YkgJ family cysteine cluster protein [Thermoproteota archaeon]
MTTMLSIALPIARRNELFKCKLCGWKCCSLHPEISEEDLERIRRVSPFFKPYLSPEGKMLLMSDKGYCPFLEKGRCTIHEHKPVLCKIYPFYPVNRMFLVPFLKLPDDVEVVKHGLEEYVFFFDEECPGVGEGDHVDFDKILRIFLDAKSLKSFP